MPIVQSINLALDGIEQLYHRLVIIVGPPGSGKTALLVRYAVEIDQPVINLNIELSRALLPLTAMERKLSASNLLEDVRTSRGIVLFDNSELLFDRELELDPIRLLQNLSRTCPVVVTVCGKCTNDRLIYAELGHNEFREYSVSELLLIDAEKVSLQDPTR